MVAPGLASVSINDGGDIEVHCIGDVLSPRTAEEAVLDGPKVGSAL